MFVSIPRPVKAIRRQATLKTPLSETRKSHLSTTPGVRIPISNKKQPESLRFSQPSRTPTATRHQVTMLPTISVGLHSDISRFSLRTWVVYLFTLVIGQTVTGAPADVPILFNRTATLAMTLANRILTRILKAWTMSSDERHIITHTILA